MHSGLREIEEKRQLKIGVGKIGKYQNILWENDL
jgi:hypothetical protein